MTAAWRAWAAAALWLLVLCGAVPFTFFWATTPTRWSLAQATDLIDFRNGLVFEYRLTNATYRSTNILNGTTSFILVWQWCGTLLVALAAGGLYWLHTTAPREQQRHPVKASSSASALGAPWAAIQWVGKQTRRLLQWRVPPRGLWSRLFGAGGLTLLDLILILLWFVVHIMWMYSMIDRQLANRRTAPPARVARPASPPRVVVTEATMGMPSNGTYNPLSPPAMSRGNVSAPSPAVTTRRLVPLVEYIQGRVAVYTGWIVRLDILLLFFPLARCNFLAWVLDSDFATLVKYHRWLGHGTMLVVTIHSIMYLGIWTRDGELHEELVWNMAGTNNLAGLVATAGGWLLWLTALPAIRRRLFNLFYSCHILGAILFMAFGYMHRDDIATWSMPGVLLYLLDVALRSVQQWFNSTTVSLAAGSVKLNENGTVLTLAMPCAKNMDWVGGDILFLNIPSISWLQWHPFTVASPRDDSVVDEDGNPLLLVHVKQYDRWTKRLLTRLGTDASPLRVHVSGPYFSATRKWIQQYDRVVFVAGGIGVTPALGMLEEMRVERRLAAAVDPKAYQGAHTASLVWVCRTPEELSILPHDMAHEASGSTWLDLQLHVTAPAALPADSPKQVEKSNGSVTASSNSSNASPQKELALKVAPAPTTPARASSSRFAPLLRRTLSAFSVSSAEPTTCHTLLRHPYMTHPLLWMLAVVLCFGGGFAALCISQMFDAHLDRTHRVRMHYSYTGLLQFVAYGLGATVLPALLALAMHMGIRLRAPRDGATTAAGVGKLESAKSVTLDLAAPLPIIRGRPDLHALLSKVAAESGPSHRVGVFVAGPVPLVNGVVNACSAINGVFGRSGQAYLEVTTLTHEL